MPSAPGAECSRREALGSAAAPLLGILAVTALAQQLLASAGAPYQSSPERRTVADQDWGPWLGPFRAKLIPSLMQYFGERYLYAIASRALGPPRPGERRVVFPGDSITDRWDLARSFPGKSYVNRGIGSQVTAQMVLRFHQDVIGLKPAAVVILAGVNDVQGFLQRETPEQIEANYQAMAEMADAHGMRVVFGSLLPVNNYTQQAQNVLSERKPEELHLLNSWLRRFCRERGYAYADYYAALVDAHGLLQRELSIDSVHSLPAGYARTAPVAKAAIDRVLSTFASSENGPDEPHRSDQTLRTLRRRKSRVRAVHI